jgi:hypothetical protein
MVSLANASSMSDKGSARLACETAGMALALLAAFWVIVALFLMLAPEHVLPASLGARRYGAVGCLIFAASCVLALAA